MKQEMTEAVDFLYDLPRFTKKNSLGHTRRLMKLLGDPCADRKVIHVAGSNGKGSVCCFLYHMLLAGGVSAAMFTSPHLVDIRERFQINGDMIGEDSFIRAYRKVTEVVRKLTENGEDHPTFFEFVYAMAMLLFEEAQVEYIVLETGLGGRLDATNSYSTPILSVITPVSFEHSEILGDTVAQIAEEKAGILKPGVPVVYAADNAEAASVIASRAEEAGCPAAAVSLGGEGAGKADFICRVCEIGENAVDFSISSVYDKTTVWRVPGHAIYQVENAALAITAMHLATGMDDGILQQGLLESEWPGRMQEVLPDIYFDGAHNPSGIEAFVTSARELAKGDPYPPLLLFSMLREKDIETSVRLLMDGMDWENVAVTLIPGERGTDPGRIAMYCEAEVLPDCADAFMTMRNRKREGQKLFCTGSLYFIGTLLGTL